jgi:hypothetical protein
MTAPLTLVPSLTDDHDGFTTEPTHVRVFPLRDLNGRITDWNIDGVDDDDNATSLWWKDYPTRDAALADVPAFVERAALGGVTWRWREPIRPALAS